MSKRAKRATSNKFWQRLFWWGGIAALIGAIAALYWDVPSTILVSLGGAGLLLCFISLVIEIRRKGFTADNVSVLSGVLALSCGVLGYFFEHITWVLLTAFAGFFLFIFVSFGAQLWGQWGETQDLWRRWKIYRSEKKAMTEFQKTGPFTQKTHHPTHSPDDEPSRKLSAALQKNDGQNI